MFNLASYNLFSRGGKLAAFGILGRGGRAAWRGGGGGEFHLHPPPLMKP